MHRQSFRLAKRREEGFTLILCSLTAVVLLALTALAVDLGIFIWTSSKASLAGDLAVLAGARQARLGAGSAEIQHAVSEIARANYPHAVKYTPTVQFYGSETRVGLRQDIGLSYFFAQFVGLKGAVSVSIESVAEQVDPDLQSGITQPVHAIVLLDVGDEMMRPYDEECSPHLMPDVDRSQCNGEYMLDAAKRAAREVVTLLHPEDRLSLIVYDLEYRVLSEYTAVDQHNVGDVLAAIDSIPDSRDGRPGDPATGYWAAREIGLRHNKSGTNTAVVWLSPGDSDPPSETESFCQSASSADFDTCKPRPYSNEATPCSSARDSCRDEAYECYRRVDPEYQRLLAMGVSRQEAYKRTYQVCIETNRHCQLDAATMMEEKAEFFLYELQEKTGARVYSVGVNYMSPFVAGSGRGTDEIRRRNLLIDMSDDRSNIMTRKGDIVTCAPKRRAEHSGNYYNQRRSISTEELQGLGTDILAHARRDEDGVSYDYRDGVRPHLVPPG